MMDGNGDYQMPDAAKEPQREGLSIREACIVAGIGRTRLYAAIAEGVLTARKHGRRTLVLRSDLNRFLEALPNAKDAEGCCVDRTRNHEDSD
jgi:excisionase family DNA binding protein